MAELERRVRYAVETLSEAECLGSVMEHFAWLHYHRTDEDASRAIAGFEQKHRHVRKACKRCKELRASLPFLEPLVLAARKQLAPIVALGKAMEEK